MEKNCKIGIEDDNRLGVVICWPTFIDTLFWHTFPHSLCTEALFYETVSVIGLLASEYSLAIELIFH